jgi:hypothetical protein
MNNPKKYSFWGGLVYRKGSGGHSNDQLRAEGEDSVFPPLAILLLLEGTPPAPSTLEGDQSLKTEILFLPKLSFCKFGEPQGYLQSAHYPISHLVFKKHISTDKDPITCSLFSVSVEVQAPARGWAHMHMQWQLANEQPQGGHGPTTKFLHHNWCPHLLRRPPPPSPYKKRGCWYVTPDAGWSGREGFLETRARINMQILQVN